MNKDKQTKENLHDGHRQRMIEKLFDENDGLKDHELLEIILYFSIPRINTNDIAHRLLKKFGTVENVLSAESGLLTEIEGIGEKTANFIKVFHKTLERYYNRPQNNRLNIKDRVKFYEYLKEVYKNKTIEELCCFYINSKGDIIHEEWIQSNDTGSVKFDLKLILKVNERVKPASVIITHNHLSGNCKPSPADSETTVSLALLLNFAGINFYDHIIVSEDEFYSYKFEGNLDEIIENTLPGTAAVMTINNLRDKK